MKEKNEKKTTTLSCNTEVHPSITHIGQLPRYAAKPVPKIWRSTLQSSTLVYSQGDHNLAAWETTTFGFKNHNLAVSRTTTWQLQKPTTCGFENHNLTASKTTAWQLQKPQLDSFKNHNLTTSKTATWQIQNPQLVNFQKPQLDRLNKPQNLRITNICVTELSPLYVLAREPSGGIKIPRLILTLISRGPSSPRKTRRCSPNHGKRREFIWDTLFPPELQ